MAFPQTALPITHLIAPGADPAKPSTYQFTDVTSDVRYAPAIVISAGRQDEHSTASTTSHTLTLDNRAGNYSPRNPLGSYYGQLRKGTPSQTRVKLIDDQFARTVAVGLGTDPVSGQTWSSNAAYSVNGTVGQVTLATANTAAGTILTNVGSDDFDLLKVTSVPAAMTGAPWIDATYIRYQDTSNYYRVHTEYGTAGVITVKVNRTMAGASGDILATVTTSVAYSAGTKIATRIQAVGPTIRIKVWQAAGAEPAAWTASVDDTSTTVRSNMVGLYEWRFAGNTNAGSLTVNIYSFRFDTIRATTPVPEWPTRFNQTGSNVTSPVVGNGILRRLSQGQSALRSPLYRQITGYGNLVGYWPIEDGSAATQLTNTLALGPPGRLSNIALAGTGPSGSGGAGTFTNSDSSSQMNGSFLSASTTAGWQICWALKLNALPAAGTLQMVSWLTSNGYWWAINMTTTTYVVTVVDPSGSVVLNAATTFTGFGSPTNWTTFRVKGTASGGVVTAELGWYEQGAAFVAGTTNTFSGNVGALLTWTANGNASMGNGLICHVFGVTTGNDNLQAYAALRAFDGYVGEVAGQRLLRLAAQENVPLIVMGDPAKTAAMGIQSPDTFINLARECEDADQGVLLERGAGLALLTNRFRLNPPVTMPLDFNTGQIAAPPEPTDDDLNLINQVVLTRKNGSQFTAQNNASIALSGIYTDEVTTNVGFDYQLGNQAGWRLHMGTIDELRWPVITLQLHANPALIYTWCAMRIGSRITIANPPTPGDTLDLIVEGYTEVIGPFSWDVTLNCSPARPWDCGIYSDGVTRYDSARNPDGTVATTLASGITSSATSVPITTANTFTVLDPTWSTTSLPYTWEVGGEQMTVTAMTARSGTGPWTQTATVTRSVNGIVKAHLANEAVDLAAIRYYALPV